MAGPFDGILTDQVGDRATGVLPICSVLRDLGVRMRRPVKGVST